MIINRNFYNQNTIKVAQKFLGCILARKYKGKIARGIITETEAYRGEDDLACHASRGRTNRTEVMYGEPGHAYVYMIYGMYFMLNIVTEKKDFPAAVLIRGLKTDKMELNGPGKVTKYFHIDKTVNGWDLTRGQKLWIEEPTQKISKKSIVAGRRIGVDYAQHCREWKWNFRIT